MIIKPHSEKQARAILCQKNLLLGTGTQWGKTQVGAIRMKQKIHSTREKDDAFIVTAPSYKIMSQSSLPAFLKLMDKCGKYNAKYDVFETYWGPRVYFRTETDPDSVVGITNVKHIWGDEAGKYRLYFWENIQARADFFGASVDLTTSPYSLNWVFKDIIKPYRKGLRDDFLYIKAASWENPYHSLSDPERREAKLKVMDERRFNMQYGGEFGKMEGLVFDCWEDEENLIAPFDLPNGTKFVAGIDWGYYPDPFVLKVRGITPDGRHYGVSEFVKNRLTITDIADICKQKKEIYDIKRFYCDPSQPANIEELCRNGLSALGADNSIRKGLDFHYELIKTRRYKEFIGACPISQDERETYHYPEQKDLRPDDNSKELLPVGQNDHCMDVDRYITIETIREHEKTQPTVPGERQDQETVTEKLQRLKRHSNYNQQTENW